MRKYYYCPLCDKKLTNRVSEVSHFRSHVRRGEMIEGDYDADGTSFAIPEYPRYFIHGIELKKSWPLEPFDEAYQWCKLKFIGWLKRGIGT